VLVEDVELLGCYPVLLKFPVAGVVNFEVTEVVTVEIEYGDIANRPVSLVLCVPVPGDADRVALGRDRIEDGLSVEARRAAPPPGLFDKVELGLPYRPEQVDHIHPRSLTA